MLVGKKIKTLIDNLTNTYNAAMVEHKPVADKEYEDKWGGQKKVIDDMNKQNKVVKDDNDYDVIKANIRQKLSDMKKNLSEISKSSNDEIKSWAIETAGPFLAGLETKNDSFTGLADQDSELNKFYSTVQKTDTTIKKNLNKARSSEKS